MFLTDEVKAEIERTGIIPSELLPAYLASKNLVRPEPTAAETAAAEATYKTMYDAYKANMKKAQKAANEQLQGRRR